MTTTTDTLTITLSDRRPVRIVESDWPIIASAHWFSGQHECQANEIARIRVRQHENDGRVLVYGHRGRGPGGMPIEYRGAAGGFLLVGKPDAEVSTWLEPSSNEIVRAIRRVAGIIGMDDLGDECIADLPAEEL